MVMPRRKKFQSRRLLKKWLVLGALALIILLLALELTNTTHLFHKPSVPPVIPVTTGVPSSSNSTQASEQPPSGSKDSAPTDSSSTKVNLPLYAPYGDFVSNHHPNLSGQPAPSKESSVCNTTPGASCYIQLTKGSVTTKLPTRVTDSKGTAYWTWDVKTAGLTTGDWTVKAVASLNGQTKTTQDPLQLTVSQ
jgi:hypothetical protein